jgi:hypothetical protein
LPWLFLHFLLWNIPCPPRYISARASAESQASCMDGHSLRRRRPNWCWPSHTYLACFLRVSRFFVSAARHAYVRTAWSDLGVEALRQQRNSRTCLGFRPSLWSTPDVPPDVYSVVLEPALCCASLCGQAFSVEDENERNQLQAIWIQEVDLPGRLLEVLLPPGTWDAGSYGCKSHMCLAPCFVLLSVHSCGCI